MDQSEADVLAYMSFPSQHRTKLHSSESDRALNKEVKRRPDAVDWLDHHRKMQLASFAPIDVPEPTRPPAMTSFGHTGFSTTLTDVTGLPLPTKQSEKLAVL